MLLDNLLVMGDGDKFNSHLRFTGTKRLGWATTTTTGPNDASNASFGP